MKYSILSILSILSITSATEYNNSYTTPALNPTADFFVYAAYNDSENTIPEVSFSADPTNSIDTSYVLTGGVNVNNNGILNSLLISGLVFIYGIF